MRRNPIPLIIFILAIVGLAGAYAVFETLVPRYAATRQVLGQKSEIRLAMTVRYDKGPLTQEIYTMNDLDGVSSSAYKAVSRNGTSIAIAERPRKTLEAGPNVAYFFGLTVQDGIWELQSRPSRGYGGPHYAISIYQLTDTQHGSHAFTFTDPHYWATTGGHQFTLKLARDKPLPDLLQMSSKIVVEPRYERLVTDFRTFGPESFRTKVAAARLRLGASARS